jgi:hypothetical protein
MDSTSVNKNTAVAQILEWLELTITFYNEVKVSIIPIVLINPIPPQTLKAKLLVISIVHHLN